MGRTGWGGQRRGAPAWATVSVWEALLGLSGFRILAVEEGPGDAQRFAGLTFNAEHDDIREAHKEGAHTRSVGLRRGWLVSQPRFCRALCRAPRTLTSDGYTPRRSEAPPISEANPPEPDPSASRAVVSVGLSCHSSTPDNCQSLTGWGRGTYREESSHQGVKG